MKIAIAADISQLECNRAFDNEWVDQFPGCGWLPMVKDILPKECELVTSDLAVSHIDTGYWNAKDVLVIQHANDHNCIKLIKKGCVPFILTILESPLYAGYFYDNVKILSSKFHNLILFNGLLGVNKNADNFLMHFPSFYAKELHKGTTPWQDRKLLVSIFSNKYEPFFNINRVYTVSDLSWTIFRKSIQLIRGSYHPKTIPIEAIQLQDRRLEFVLFFLENGVGIDVFGKWWDQPKRLPPYWRNKFYNVLPFIDRSVFNKKETIGEYKFCLCFENVSFSGYITEKIIDCLVAGVIPIYEGAPDVDKFIPKECFVDMRAYNNLEDLNSYLRSMSSKDAEDMIEFGRSFLRSNIGAQYSYEGFSNFIVKLINNYYK
jgi:hypothetical protein